MRRLLGKIAGPIVTLLILMALYSVPFPRGTTALAFVPLVWSAYVGGLAPALASAIIIVAYTVLAYPPDYIQLAQVAVAAVVIAAMVGYLKRHAELSQSLNGNMVRLREAVTLTRRLKIEWADMSDSGRYKVVELLEDRLGNLAALVFGWHSISVEQAQIKRDLVVQGIESDDVA